MLGRELELPLDLMVGRPPGVSQQRNAVHDYVSCLREKLEMAHRLARQQMKKSVVLQKKQYDHRATNDPLKEGDLAWLFSAIKQKGVSPKLSRVWKGPYRIVKKLSDCTYCVKLSAKAKPKVVHRNRLLKYEGVRGNTNTIEEPVVEDVDRTGVAENPVSQPVTTSGPRTKRKVRAPNRYGEWDDTS